jgi:hypothetical protein
MVAGMSEEMVEGDALGEGDVLAGVVLRGRRRGHDRTRRTPRLSVVERAEIEAAAAAVGMTVNGFTGEAVLSSARGTAISPGAAQDRATLARLQAAVVRGAAVR